MRSARTLPALVFIVVTGAAGCLLAPVDFTGKSCTADQDCLDGYVCVAEACRAQGAVDEDAGERPDEDSGAPAVDGGTPLDAGTSDGGGAQDGGARPDGGSDGGTALPDAGPCIDDAREPNDAQGSAATGVSSGASLTLCPDDEDWFSVPMTSGQRIVATIGFRNADGDLALQLVGPNGTTLGSADTQGDGEQLSVITTQTGNHLVRVTGAPGARAPYVLAFVVDDSSIAASLSTSDGTLEVGQSATLFWSTTNANSCSLNQGLGAVAQSGGAVIVAPESNTVYELTCTNGVDVATSQVSIVVGTCLQTCTWDFVAHTRACGTDPVATIGASDAVILDMAGVSGFQLKATFQNPTGYVIDIGDSPTNDGIGGDEGTTCHNAEIRLQGALMTVFGNEESPVVLLPQTSVIAASGSSELRLLVEDGRIAEAPERSATTVVSPYALRLDPPPCSPPLGTPDAIWYLGLNRVVDLTNSPERTGSGLLTATLCMR